MNTQSQNCVLLRKKSCPSGKAERYDYSLADGFEFA